MNAIRSAALLLAAGCAPAWAQSGLTIYGRVDLSVAQQADAKSNTELRNGSGSRLGIKAIEDLGDGFKAYVHLEHRFNASDGTTSTARFWEGRSVVGLQDWWGRFGLGREENPAYSFSQTVADPWGTDTVASNGSIVSGRIGSTRYSSSVNYRHAIGAFNVGAQFAEATANQPAGGGADKRPFSVGAAYGMGAWTFGFGYENPADRDDHWATANVAYDFGMVKLSALVGGGRNVEAQRHRAYLVAAAAPLRGGELRASYGELKNTDLTANGVLDQQAAIGYLYPLSKRTTVYADLVREGRDNMPVDRKRVGWDVGLKHNF